MCIFTEKFWTLDPTKYQCTVYDKVLKKVFLEPSLSDAREWPDLRGDNSSRKSSYRIWEQLLCQWAGGGLQWRQVLIVGQFPNYLQLLLLAIACQGGSLQILWGRVKILFGAFTCFNFVLFICFIWLMFKYRHASQPKNYGTL